jgi:hypothetical protein
LHPLWGGVTWITPPIWMNSGSNHTDDHSFIMCAAQMRYVSDSKTGREIMGRERDWTCALESVPVCREPRQSRLTFREPAEVDLFYSEEILSIGSFRASALHWKLFPFIFWIGSSSVSCLRKPWPGSKPEAYHSAINSEMWAASYNELSESIAVIHTVYRKTERMNPLSVDPQWSTTGDLKYSREMFLLARELWLYGGPKAKSRASDCWAVAAEEILIAS